MVPRSSRGEVGPSLIADMARQCRLSRAEFLALVDCSLTGSEYRQKLLDESPTGSEYRQKLLDEGHLALQ